MSLKFTRDVSDNRHVLESGWGMYSKSNDQIILSTFTVFQKTEIRNFNIKTLQGILFPATEVWCLKKG